MVAEDYCPHCDGATHTEYEGPYRIQPTYCVECGAHEFFDSSDIITADDQEAWAGWSKGEGGTSHVEIDDIRKANIEAMRASERQLLAERTAERKARATYNEAQKRYRDEAMF